MRWRGSSLMPQGRLALSSLDSISRKCRSRQTRILTNLNESFRFSDFAEALWGGFTFLLSFPLWRVPELTSALLAITHKALMLSGKNEKGLTSFWPSAAYRFLSHPSLSPASPISNSSLRGLSVLVSLSLSHYSLVCNVCILVMCVLQSFHSVISLSAGFFHCL